MDEERKCEIDGTPVGNHTGVQQQHHERIHGDSMKDVEMGAKVRFLVAGRKMSLALGEFMSHLKAFQALSPLPLPQEVAIIDDWVRPWVRNGFAFRSRTQFPVGTTSPDAQRGSEVEVVESTSQGLAKLCTEVLYLTILCTIMAPTPPVKTDQPNVTNKITSRERISRAASIVSAASTTPIIVQGGISRGEDGNDYRIIKIMGYGRFQAQECQLFRADKTLDPNFWDGDATEKPYAKVMWDPRSKEELKTAKDYEDLDEVEQYTLRQKSIIDWQPLENIKRSQDAFATMLSLAVKDFRESSKLPAYHMAELPEELELRARMVKAKNKGKRRKERAAKKRLERRLRRAEAKDGNWTFRN